MDRFVTKKTSMQTTLNQKYKREEREEVCQQIARFFYTSAIPFNAVNNPEFVIMVQKIAKFGIGLKPPSYHEIRVKYLNKEVSNVMDMLEEYREEWKKTGCTIMSDGWSDRQRRSICNFLVNSPKGTVFLSSIDTSEISKTSDKVLEMLDAVVQKVGEENVVQIVTDNAANYKATGEKLMEKRGRLFWTPCAAHCIDLMLEDLDKKIKIHGETILKARKVTTYIYSRTLLHTWMKEFTKGRELIRPAVTRFATSYLTLRSLNEQKGPLLALFASNKWKNSKFVNSVEGKKVQRIILDTQGFWKSVTTCLKAALPIVKVLRMVDSDEKPAMGFIYQAMTQAKDRIKENFNNVERNYKPICDIVDERWEAQMHRPLHAAAYFLNPQFQYSPNFNANADIKIGLYTCLQRMVVDPNDRMLIDLQMDAFKNARGLGCLLQ
ncbi:uncharacterized protein LOC104901267 [Beta vulgaris subsp. vulgaris]|uniref:uncharacterized protein LOC104901267 n=1 Tax=Beta vulgaris subsp. vulgaris TaxID=3555 RepID=UPI002037580A|nr:uncharacterized protein LOC104901267 [Beta vulgaris subsp. vulgaris]